MGRTLIGGARSGKAASRGRAAVLLAIAALAVCPVEPAAAATLAGATRAAIIATDHGRWDEARKIAAQSHAPLLIKLVEWLELTRPGTDAGFPEIAHFIEQNPDWPYQTLLRKHAEDAIGKSLPLADVVAWFIRNPPIGPTGAGAYIEALTGLGRHDDATAAARQFLVDGTMTGSQLIDFTSQYRPLLRPVDFELRADRLLWAGDTDAAGALLPYLAADARQMIQARIALASASGDAPSLYSHLSRAQQNDLGVLFDRMRWFRRQNRDQDAIAVLQVAPPTLPHADRWWNERAILARHALEIGDAKTAYELARDHRQAEGSALAEGEWLAGWIALRFLHDPAAARDHFDRMLATVDKPISVARAAYWAGRAEETLGDRPAAERDYARASDYIGTFYGQLALAKLNPSARLVLPRQPMASGLTARTFANRELVQVAQLFAAINLKNRADPFVRRIGELARTPEDALEAMRLAKATNSLAAEVQVAKKLMQGGMPLLSDGYPVLRVPARQPEPALVHAIIRQESLFDSGAISPSGALGLMQLMPATARTVAGKLKVRHHRQELLIANPGYNMSLGSSYLADLVDHFSGSYVLAVASYNAGPGRVAGWLKDNGDPRPTLDDTIDWIEKISIYETRNYVQRVMENLEVYRARLGGGSAPNAIAHDLVR